MSVIDSRRYGKPCMTNLPSDLGKAIFKHILSTPAPNRAEMNAESERLVNEMLEARRKKKNMEFSNDNTSE